MNALSNRFIPKRCDHKRLWSLPEMLEFNAHAFHSVTTRFSLMPPVIEGQDSNDDSPFQKHKLLDSHYSHHFAEIFEDYTNHLEVLGAKVSAIISKEAHEMLLEEKATWGDLRRHILDIERTLTRELTLVTVLSLDSKEQSYYAPKEPLFGNEVAQNFPSEAAFEIDEAAKCLAFGRPTAAVFHLMRTMEIGVRATARCIGIADPVKGTDRNWMSILRAIKTGIDTKWPNATARMTKDATLFESLHASLDAVRNPWRNATMHVESKYTDGEAEHIFIAVKGFMKKLASRCDEKGLPLA